MMSKHTVETLFGHAPYSSQTTEELIEKIRQDVSIVVRYDLQRSCHLLTMFRYPKDPQYHIIVKIFSKAYYKENLTREFHLTTFLAILL